MELHRMKFILLLLFFLTPCNCFCNRRIDKNESNDFPTPELLFPGLSKHAVRISAAESADASELVVSLTSAIAGLVPKAGPFIKAAIKGIQLMNDKLTKAEHPLLNFVDQSIGVAAIVYIKAKLDTVENRLNDVQQKIYNGSNFDTELHIAWDKCQEILEIFTNEHSPLHKSGNALVSSPSLVSFTRVYPSVALIRFVLWPNNRQHILEEMERLLYTLKKYRDSAVLKRLSYLTPYSFNIFKLKAQKLAGKCHGFRGTIRTIFASLWRIRFSIYRKRPRFNAMFSYEDKYYEVQSCDLCFKVSCSFLACSISKSKYLDDSFNYYKNELREKYNGYFVNPIQKLEEFIEQLRK